MSPINIPHKFVTKCRLVRYVQTSLVTERKRKLPWRHNHRSRPRRRLWWWRTLPADFDWSGVARFIVPLVGKFRARVLDLISPPPLMAIKSYAESESYCDQNRYRSGRATAIKNRKNDWDGGTRGWGKSINQSRRRQLVIIGRAAACAMIGVDPTRHD